MAAPNATWGEFWDDWLGYTTKKTVFIRDRKLGYVYYGLVFVIITYIIGWQIFRNNEHFQLSRVEGIPQIKVTHPTVGLCYEGMPGCKSAYRSLHALSYCREYNGSWPLVHQASCKFLDSTSLMTQEDVDNKVFIPTAVEIVTEKRGCTPGPENGFTCDNEYVELPGTHCWRNGSMCETRDGRKEQFFFVGDTRHFQIQLTSSYEQGDVHGTSLDHPGFYEECPPRIERSTQAHFWQDRLQHSETSKHECDSPRMIRMRCLEGVPCQERRKFDLLHDTGIEKGIKKAEKGIKEPKLALNARSGARFRTRDHDQHHLATALSPERPKWATKITGDEVPTVLENGTLAWTSNYGDVFFLDRLLQLAGTNLDYNYNMDGWTVRESGTVLEISIVFTNLHPWISSFGYKEVNYYYKVKELPLPYVSRKQLAAVQPPDYPATRRYEIQYGVMIWFRVEGDFGSFNKTQLLIYLVTAGALIGVASSVTDLFAIYVHERKNTYFFLKYEVSGKFEDKWKCPKCGYMNWLKFENCQGVPMWEHQENHEVCGEPRPNPAMGRSI